MNICRVCLYYPAQNEKLGGFYQGLQNMTNAQIKLDNKVSVVTSRSISKKQKAFEKQGKVKINRLFSSVKGPLMVNYWAFGLNAARKFWELDKKENFDLIHAHDRDTFLFDFINHKRKPIFMHSHGLIKGWQRAGILDAKAWQEENIMSRLTLKSRMFPRCG